jgi:ABC-type multidrug transport system permease subunit
MINCRPSFKFLQIGFYSTLPFHISYFVVESGLLAINVAISSIIIYFLADLVAVSFIKFFGILLLQAILSVSVAQCISSWSNTYMQAYTVYVIYNLLCFVFSGLQANITNFGNSLFNFLSRIDYWRYTLLYLVSIYHKRHTGLVRY